MRHMARFISNSADAVLQYAEEGGGLTRVLAYQAADALKSATSIDDLLAALDRRIAKNVTPHMVPAGSMGPATVTVTRTATAPEIRSVTVTDPVTVTVTVTVTERGSVRHATPTRARQEP